MAERDRAEFEYFFLISSGHSPNALHVKADKSAPWDKLGSEPAAINRLVLGEFKPGQVLGFTQFSGDLLTDLVTTGYSRLRLISDRLVQVLRNENISGWSSFPVIIRKKDGALVDGYQGLSISGRCGPIDNSLSIVQDAPVESPWRGKKVAMGYYFDKTRWDGSELFTPNGGLLMATERVKQILEKDGATNIRFDRLTECINLTATMQMRGGSVGEE
jgi:hypothetical protein